MKFLSSSITSPSVTSLKKNTPANENIKKKSISNIITLSKDGIEKTIVLIIAYKSSALPNNLITLVTLKTLNNLAI